MTDPFALIAATWPPAETVTRGPWTLRRGGGGGSRVSAATLDGPFADLDGADAVMRGWGQRPLVMIRPGDTALDAALSSPSGQAVAVHEDGSVAGVVPGDAVMRAIEDQRSTREDRGRRP